MLTQPYLLTYSPGAEDKPLDAFIYAPHGGNFERFMEMNPYFKDKFWLEPEVLRQICVMEGDQFTPGLAYKATGVLAAMGLNVAVMEILVPREILDMNRVLEDAIKPTFDYERMTDIRGWFEQSYDQMAKKRDELIDRLKPSGKFMDVHTMRPGGTLIDLKPSPRIPTLSERNGNEIIQPGPIELFYAERIEALKKQNEITEPRSHCLVAHYGDETKSVLEMVADPLVTATMKRLFKTYNIPHNESEVYYFLDHMVGHKKPYRYNQGILVDFVKTAFCEERLGHDFDLLNLTTNPKAIEEYGILLARTVIMSQEKTLALEGFKLFEI